MAKWIPFRLTMPPPGTLVVQGFMTGTSMPPTPADTLLRYRALYGTPSGSWRFATAEESAEYYEQTRIAEKGNNYEHS